MLETRILLVDDEEQVLDALVRALKKLPVNVFTATSGQTGLSILEKMPINIVVSDLNMPEMDGNQFLSIVADQYPETIRMILTAHTDLSNVLTAVNQGRVWGYLQKPWDNDEFRITINQAIQFNNLQLERSILQRRVDKYETQRKPNFEGFIGDSIPMQFVYSAIESAAPSGASVFITGQSGTGKEVAAAAIHHLSSRKNNPFIALNCAAIPSELMESEIFGHVKGAFSGAVNNRDGAAGLAHEGTLFLDEIGEMDISLQAKLLRFIQTGTYQKVGSSKTEKVDIRFISATNREPFSAIESGHLREDLFYRLNVISIDLPPLNQRDNDVIQIAKHFLEAFSKQENKSIIGLTQEAEAFLIDYPWPGNIRQLQNAMHSAVVMSKGPLIDIDSLQRQLKIPPTAATITQLAHISHTNITPPATSHEENTTIKPLIDVERSAIEYAIKECEDNVVQAASKLGVSPSTLYRKIQQWQQ